MNAAPSVAQTLTLGSAYRLQACRHGWMLYNVNDRFIGRSLALYGEFSQGEVDLFAQLLRSGQTVIDAGANIGAHTVFFAKAVGPTGTVIAVEPQRLVFQTLCANVALNQLANVHTYWSALGESAGQIRVPVVPIEATFNFGGVTLNAGEGPESSTGAPAPTEPVPQMNLDSMNLPACHLLKVDVEGMESAVLAGAVETIARCRPFLYVENDRPASMAGLIRQIEAMGYRLYWHRPTLFNPGNFAGNAENVFPTLISRNMIGVPQESPLVVQDLPPVTLP